MPRPSKGARLYLRPARRDSAGAIVKDARWIIRDGSREVSTGCGKGEIEDAERKLAAYVSKKYAPPRRQCHLDEIPVGDVISVYTADIVPSLANPEKTIERLDRLTDFFGDSMLDKITGEFCHKYVAHRQGKGRSNKGTGGGARRDLQDLAAAIAHHHRCGLHRETVLVVLPTRGESRKRWLTREEVRRLWRICVSTREMQEGLATDKRPLAHLARFILFGAYTGSRPGALLLANWDQAIGRGLIDLERGLFYRHADGARATDKRQPPVPLTPALWRLMRRWAAQDGRRGPVVRYGAAPVASVRTALKRAVRLAGLDAAITAYTLRHTTASWLLQAGVSTAKTAAILGTSEAMIERHYGHLAPDHLREEVAMIGRRVSGS